MSNLIAIPDSFKGYATAFHVSAWSDLALVVPPIAKVLATIGGRTTAGDGGGGHFYWDSASTATDDTGTVLNPGLGSKPGRWIRIHEKGILNAAWFGVSAANTDNSSALAAALTAVKAVGGTLRLPAGTLRHASMWDIKDTANISIEGAGPMQAVGNTVATILQYTGTGTADTDTTVSLASSVSVTLRYISFQPVATFNGVIVNFGHSNVGNDPLGCVIEKCDFRGQGLATHCTGIFLAQTIQTTIRDCSFNNLYRSIVGVTGTNTLHSPGEGDYATNVGIYNCLFDGGQIQNPHWVWVIDECTVEGPGLTSFPANVGYFIDQDLTPGFQSISVEVRNCLCGDPGALDLWINQTNCQNFLAQNNMFAGGVRSMALAGVHARIQGNNFVGGAHLDFPYGNGTMLGITVVDNNSLHIDHEAGANIKSVSGYDVTMFGNSGDGSYTPPILFGNSSATIVMGGLKPNNYGSVINGYLTTTVSSPTWSPAGPIASGSIAFVDVNITSLGGLNAAATCSAGLSDFALPAGVFLVANLHTNGNFIRATLINLSGSPYTPTGTLRVDGWLN